MELVKHDQYIRVDISERADIQGIIKEIKRHVDGIEWVGEQYDSCSYIVDGTEYDHKAEAILAKLLFEENFEDACNVILDSNVNDYEIGCSRIENDVSNDRTDRTRHSKKTAYEIVEILVIQPYIHYLSWNMGQKLKDAFTKLSEEIVKAKKIDIAAFVAQS